MIPVIAGLSFGDEGKGGCVDYICATQKIGTVVRYNGGPQAAHNVVLPDGRTHTYSQFGSGYGQGADTFLSRYMLVDPYALMNEADALGKASIYTVYIDEDALIITPYHWIANHIRERRDQHGSCGRGVGECASYAVEFPNAAIRAKDLSRPGLLWDKLGELREYLSEKLGEEVDHIETRLKIVENFAEISRRLHVVKGQEFLAAAEPNGLVFEGAQGVLLDEWYGFHPHTTWSTTTYENADTLLAEIDKKSYHVGVIRSYTTRHGNGPFPTEDPELNHPEAHNTTGEWQGAWRQGHFDLPLLQYAVECCDEKVDELFITHMDRWSEESKMCMTYADGDMIPEVQDKYDLETRAKTTEWLNTVDPLYYTGYDAGKFSKLVEIGTGVPVGMWSFGPTCEDKEKLAKGRLPFILTTT